MAKVRPRWSVARVMSGIAVLAVGLAVMLALRPTPLVGDALIGILCFLMAVLLAAATDRALELPDGNADGSGVGMEDPRWGLQMLGPTTCQTVCQSLLG